MAHDPLEPGHPLAPANSHTAASSTSALTTLSGSGLAQSATCGVKR